MKRIVLFAATAGCALIGWRLGAPSTPSADAGVARFTGDAQSPPPSPPGSAAISESGAPFELLALSSADYPARLRAAFRSGAEVETRFLAKRWAERDPAALFAFMISPEGLGLYPNVGDDWEDSIVTEECFGAWFRSDPAAAVAAFESLAIKVEDDPFSGGDYRRGRRPSFAAWEVVMPAFLKADPARAMLFMAEHAEATGPLLMSFDQCRALAEISLTMPACASRPALLSSVLSGFCNEPDAARGRANGAAWLAKLPPDARLEAVPSFDGTQGLPVLKDVLRGAFTEAELAALERGLKPGVDTEKLETLARLRALGDPAAAMAWADANLKGKARLHAKSEILNNSVPDSPAEATAFLDSVGPGPLREHALEATVRHYLEKGEQAAAGDWLLTLPDPKEREEAMSELMDKWVLGRPDDCARWIAGLSDSKIRSSAATAALDGAGDLAAQLRMASALPWETAEGALEMAWYSGRPPDVRSLAGAAAEHAPGAVREAAMAVASEFLWTELRGYNQEWLDWAAALPEPADRAAVWRRVEKNADQPDPRWAPGIREAARARLGTAGGG